MAEAWRRRDRQGGGFLGFGAHSLYQEAPEVIQWGSWLLCSPPSVIWAGLGKTLYSSSQLIESDGNAIDSYARAFFELKGIYILFDATIHEKKINIGYSHHFIFIILLHLIISKYVEHTNLMFLSTAIQISEFNLNSQEQAL